MTAFGPAAQLADAIARRGAQITLRRLTRTPGPVPLLNPPRVNNAVVDGAVLQGATVIALRADYAMGRLVAGDAISAAGLTLHVTGPAAAKPVTAVPPGFAAIPIEPAPAPIADGTLVALAFGADLKTAAMVESFPKRLIDGERIQLRDLSVDIAAYPLNGAEIETTWGLILGTRELSIVAATPVYEQGEVMRWAVQAR